MSISIKAFLQTTLFFPLIFAAQTEAAEKVFRVGDNTVTSLEQLVPELKGVDAILVGELHDNKKHHAAQLAIIKALNKAGINFAIGIEMLPASAQTQIDAFLSGAMKPDVFQKIFEDYWKHEWSLYKDIFFFAKSAKLPVIGLNVSKSVSRKVGYQGVAALTPEETATVPPDIFCEVDGSGYMDFLRTSLMSHGQEERSFIYFCEAMVLWDKAMAWHTMDALKQNPGKQMVVFAGVGHAWKRGIPLQLRKNSDFVYRVILPELSRGIHRKTISPEIADYLIFE
ncbi:MAG: ChaN family lipoprotein [Nitrospirae bacterium]|nr:ChaN family lipoprotein [Nitrospirota bacterium]